MCFEANLNQMTTYSFTRQDAIALSGLTRSKLQLLINRDFVVPEKDGVGKTSKSFYSWEQILELRTIFKLRKNASFQKLQEAKKSLRELGLEECLSCHADKYILAFNNQIYLKDAQEIITILAGKNKGQIVMAILIQDILNDIENLAKSNNIVDFERKKLGLIGLVA